jgi:hypothetical protein
MISSGDDHGAEIGRSVAQCYVAESRVALYGGQSGGCRLRGQRKNGMLEDRCRNLEELNQWLSSIPSDALFRGQRNQFTKNGQTCIATSFERHGCVPPLMFKWRYYANELIRLLGKGSSLLLAHSGAP